MSNNEELSSIQDLKVSSKYHHSQYFHILDKFTPRGCYITKAERIKINSLKLDLDDYLDLIEFEVPSRDFLYGFYRQVLKYNSQVNAKDLPVFLPLFSGLVYRLKATCTIQAGWRAYKERKNNIPIQELIHRRSVLCIQRWWRHVKCYRRLLFLTQLSHYLSEITSPTVYLQEHLFEHLSPSKPSSLSVTEEDFSFYCRTGSIYVTFNRKQLLPSWLGVTFSEDASPDCQITEEGKTLQGVILNGAKIDIVSLHTEATNKSCAADANLKFLKLEYSTTEEAKRRAAVLFLKTLDHSSNSYIPFVPFRALEHPFLMTELRKIWVSRRIDPTTHCKASSTLQEVLSLTVKEETTLTPAPLFRVKTLPEVPKLEGTKESTHNTQELPTSNKELTRRRIKKLNEEKVKRKLDLQLTRETEEAVKKRKFKEEKETTRELRTAQNWAEGREKSLRRSLVMAQRNRQKHIDSEKNFILQFAQNRNMLQKLINRSNLERLRHKSQQAIQKRVAETKQKSHLMYKNFIEKHCLA